MRHGHFLTSLILICVLLPTATGTSQTPATENAGPKQTQSSGDAESNAKSSKVFRLGDPGVTAPKALHNPEPAYTDDARRNNLEGKVGLNVIIDNKGRVSFVSVQKPLGMGLDESAVKTVKQWRFTPATKDGNPVAIQVFVEVEYSLHMRH
jgi:TonB family protein